MSLHRGGAVVLTYGQEPRHEPLVRALQSEGLASDRIVVTHNPVQRGAPDVSQDGAGVRVVRNERNLGYGAAINRGLVELWDAGVDWAFLVADDVQFEPGALSIVNEALEHNPRIGVLGTRMVMDSSGELFSVGAVCGRGSTVRHLEAEALPRAQGGLLACSWVDGAAWTIRLDTLRAVGLLDERYFMYYEEPLLCWQARQQGWQVATAIDAVVKQEPGYGKRVAAYDYLLTRNGLDFARRAKGRRGLIYALALKGRDIQYTSKTLSRRDATPEAITYARQRIAGLSKGVRDYLRKQWGAPPALPGASDITGT